MIILLQVPTGGAGIGEDTAQEALKSYTFDPSKRGKFEYIPTSNILSYIILKKSGRTRE